MSAPSAARFSSRKISETLLDFAEPLLRALGNRPKPDAVEAALRVAWTVWNAVGIEQATGNGHMLNELRDCTGANSIPRALCDELIERKRAVLRFATDHRLMGELKLVCRNGQWVLKLEARTPPEKAAKGS
jgi:hypothetical protein